MKRGNDSQQTRWTFFHKESMSNHVRWFLIIFMFGNLVWIILVAKSVTNHLDLLRVLGTMGLVSGASIICGAFLGFLFGIPRSMTGVAGNLIIPDSAATNGSQQSGDPKVSGDSNSKVATASAQTLNVNPATENTSSPPPTPAAAAPAPAAPTPNASSSTASVSQVRQQKAPLNVAPNTNLEQISDWLTKILVGVGLTEIRSLRSGISALDVTLNSALVPLENGGAVAISIGLAYGVAGFLWAYFEARTSLMLLFGEST
ncbi:hypothetical protein [Paraburkholderia sp. J8-2]|uniref:hypothetical protein n=1 Tax=Paraburkholderia sp. J8-2 TaxID=2805440 RepID=UPI002AB5DEF9|nr:hypothetical protein [Paraburkholderia sp. J8-2]